MRNFSPELLDLLDEGRVHYAGMIRVDLGGGSFGVIHSPSDYVWGGVTFKAMPRGIIAVSASPMSTGTAASGFTITIAESVEAGLTPDQIANWESYDYMDRQVIVYDLHIHPDSGAILGDPVIYARGYINEVQHDDDPASGYLLTLNCEDRAMDFNRQNGRFATHEDQQRRDAGDKGLIHTATAGTIEVLWGRRK